MNTFDLEFTKPGKTYKMVKSVSMAVANSVGTILTAKVPVYLRTADTPVFSVGLPKEYVDFYEANRDRLREERGLQRPLNIVDGVLTCKLFEDVEGILKWFSQAFAEDVKNRRIKKVIGIELMLFAPGVSVNPPSFNDGITHIAGLRAEILYEVNGSLYRNRRRADDAVEGYLPKWPDLHYIAKRGVSLLEFDLVSWETLVAIKDTLARAAETLARLQNPTEAALLLSSGTLLLK